MAWIIPKDPSKRAEYWLTRKSADAAPGYGLDLPDRRFRGTWNGRDAWLMGDTYWTQQGEKPALVLLHSNNGWRIEESDGAATL